LNRILTCLTTQHEWSFVLMAAVVCVVGVVVAIVLLSLAHQASQSGRRAYVLFGAGVAGLAIWTTHFLAMLGYRWGVPVSYRAPELLASLAIILIGMLCYAGLALDGGTRRRRVLGLAAAASATAAMHIVGVMGLSVEGARVTLEPAFVGGSILAGVVLALLAALPDASGRLWRLSISSGLLVASVLVIHLGVMSAINVVLDPTVLSRGGIAHDTLLILLALTGSLITMTAAFVAGVEYWSRTNALGHLREAIDAMPGGLGFYDSNDRLMVWNARYAEVNPAVASSLRVGMPFREALKIDMAANIYAEAEGREAEWLTERMTARKLLSHTMEQELTDGRWLRVQDRKTAAGGTVTVCDDITDLKRDAAALTAARDEAETANRAKSEFLANMSHEIRTPLNGVIGLAQALSRTDLTPDQQEMLDLIQSSGRTLQVLLSDILDLARVESGRMELTRETFDLARAVADAGQLYASAAAEKGLQFYVDIDPNAALWMHGDSVRLKQVLTNLVSNAVKFTSEGFVSLTASRGARPDGSPILRFTVEDTGVGFDAEARARLFTRFEQADGTITRRFGGTGLGLAICRELVEMMGGELDCESEPDGGSAFILTLPLLIAEAPTAHAEGQAPSAPPEAARTVRVLLADDHATNRRVVELILAQAPVALTCVEDGAQALSAYQSTPFDLVLMDMQMPIMDGLTATREIRLHEAVAGLDRTPIVMLTANALPDHVAASLAAGVDHHLAKPFNAAELLGLVSDLSILPKAIAA